MQTDAKAYAKNNSFQVNFARQYLGKYIGESWRQDTAVFEVGSRTGEVAHYISTWPNVKSVHGIERTADMVNYAMKYYQTENISFSVADIQDEDDIEADWIGRFDCVCSFHALHWVTDGTSAISNINRVLKIGGKALLHLVWPEEQAFGHALQQIQGMAKWAKYLSEIPKTAVPWLRIALNPDEKSQYVHMHSREDFRKVVESSGFTVEKFDPDKITISMTAAVCRGFLPHYGFVPEGLHSELTADLQRLMSERTRTDSNNDPVIDEDMVFILATKTRNMNS